MLPRRHPDRIRITFDDCRLVANAGLLLPATLARHLGLAELVRQCLDLGDAPGRANTGDKMMTLVASALAGGDCIDAADVLRSFRWGHVRQLDRVSRELLARAGAGPGDAPFTIYLDSTLCETSSPTTVVTRQSARQEVRRWCVPEHRAWAPAGSPVVPPGALSYATPAADTVSRSIERRHPRIPGRSAA